jgi:spore coat protein U-like protein
VRNACSSYAAAAAALLVSGAVLAQGDTRTIQVTANVTGSCTFDSTPNMSFGDLNPASPIDKSQAIEISFKCTKGLAYQLTFGNGLHYSGGMNRMVGASGGDYIPYEVSPKTQGGNGQGFESPVKITITGTVRAANYRNVSAGAYADTVTLTVAP